MKGKLIHLLYKETPIAPLVIFRIIIGCVLLYGTVRTGMKGWIKELYVEPSIHFPFFESIAPLPELGMYLCFLLMAISAIGIIVGGFYRISTASYFLIFTYIELIDKTYYLNHYYLVSLLTFWLFFVPANRWYSLDAYRNPEIASSRCLNWHTLIFKLQISMVYFFAGIAKINPDWLLKAQPMATWLPSKYELPLLGKIMHFKEVAFLFSWMGCVYDVTIWIFLWMKKTRWLAYIAVIVFHVLTGILFPRIGMFPIIMMGATIIFFSPEWHQKIMQQLPLYSAFEGTTQKMHSQYSQNQVISIILAAYLIVQLYLPLRYVQYDGNLFWHEKGYRFSWRVMLMEKNGFTSIIVKDPLKNIQYEVNQDEYLTPFQQQQMKSQPDMILQFVKHIGGEFTDKNGYAPNVFVDSRMSLNGRRSQEFTNKTIDIYSLQNPMEYNWVTEFKE